MIGLVLCSLLLLPGTAAGQEPTPLRGWQRLYNSLATEAGLAVVALADDPDPFLVYSLLSSEQRSDQGIGPWPIRVDDESWARSFAAEVDPSRLAHMEIADVRFPDASLEDHPRWLESAERQARILGADDLTQRLALVSLDDQLFDIGFTLVRYGDRWQVLDQAASLGNTDAWGAAHPTTLEDFEAQTSGEADAS